MLNLLAVTSIIYNCYCICMYTTYYLRNTTENRFSDKIQ